MTDENRLNRAELRSIQPSLRNRMQAWISEHTGDDRAAYRSAGRYLDALDLTPVGAMFMADEGGRELASGNPALGAAMVGISMVPGGNKLAKPLSREERLARAQDMGFDTNRTFYHGTAGDFDSFDLTKGGQTSGSRAGSMGVSVSPSPAVANEFAESAARSGGNPNVMPLYQRSEKRALIDLDGSETNLEVSSTLAEAWDAGYDAVVLRNYTTPNGAKNQTVLILKDPSQLRSVNAAFDPAKRDSRNILAGAAGLAVAPMIGSEPDGAP